MSNLGKLGTALRLAARLDGRTLRRQWLRHSATRRLRASGGTPLVHSDPGFPFVCHPDWPDSVQQFRHQDADDPEFGLLRRWLEPGDRVFDIGANLGLYTFAAAAQVGLRGQVVAVEAAPFVADKLRLSARLLGATQVEIAQAAVAAETGEVTFYVAKDATTTTEQSILPAADRRSASSPVIVPAVTLRDLALEHASGAPPALVKIDIEGAEAAALAAAPAAWLAADGPLWIVEINPAALARFGATPDTVTAAFPPEAFDCWLWRKHLLGPDRLPGLRPLTPGEAYGDSRYYNLVALPRGGRLAARRHRIAAAFAA